MGFCLLHKGKKSGPKKMKHIRAMGWLMVDHLELFSDLDIQARNKAILASIDSSSKALEAAKTWKIGALLLLSGPESRAANKALLLKSIFGIQHGKQ